MPGRALPPIPATYTSRESPFPGGENWLSETAIALSVTVLTLLGIGIGCAAAWARRHGNVLRAHRLRLALPAFFFACALLNASHSWQHPSQRLIGVLLGGGFTGSGRDPPLTPLQATRQGCRGSGEHPRQGGQAKRRTCLAPYRIRCGGNPRHPAVT